MKFIPTFYLQNPGNTGFSQFTPLIKRENAPGWCEVDIKAETFEEAAEIAKAADYEGFAPYAREVCKAIMLIGYTDDERRLGVQTFRYDDLQPWVEQ